ncbi:MAG TPA: hypothetical protein VMR95_01810 [Candidatus Binatia bacterium]|nr:hypothetical protein [Candidatus Binatia bacterium]
MLSLNQQIANYRPNPKTLAAIARITLVTVIGPAGVGKTTLMEQAARTDKDIHLVLSDTSRLARPGEANGVSYFFRSREEMFELLNQRAFVQIAPIVSGDLYGSSPASFGEPGKIAMMAVWSEAMFQFRTLPFHALHPIFIVPPDFKEWQRRLEVREFSPAVLNNRLAEAKRSFEFALSDDHLNFIINDDLKLALDNFLKLAHGQVSLAQSADQARAREIIKDILNKLS